MTTGMSRPSDGFAASLRQAGALLVMLCGSLMIGLTFTVVAPILPEIARRIPIGGNGALAAQMVMTVPSLGIIISGPITGAMARHWGAAATLLICFIAMGAFGTVGLFAENPWFLLGSRALLGVAAMGCATSSVAIIGQLYAGDRRAKLIGFQVAVASGGSAVALLVSGMLADKVGWRAPFVLYLLPLVLALLTAICLLRAPAAAPEAATPQAAAGASPSGQSVLQLWPLYLLSSVLAIPLNLPGIQIGFELADDGITSALLISVVVAAYSVSLTLAAISFGRVRARLSIGRVIALGLLCLGSGFIGVALSHAALPMALFCLLAGTGAGLLNPVVTVMLFDRAAPAARDPAIGLLNSSFFTGELLSPVILIPLRATLGVHGLFGLVGGLLVAIGLKLGASAFSFKASPPLKAKVSK